MKEILRIGPLYGSSENAPNKISVRVENDERTGILTRAYRNSFSHPIRKYFGEKKN